MDVNEDKCQNYQEVGHWLAAAPRGVKMGIPYLIPNITLGSFGAVTQVRLVRIRLILELSKLK